MPIHLTPYQLLDQVANSGSEFQCRTHKRMRQFIREQNGLTWKDGAAQALSSLVGAKVYFDSWDAPYPEFDEDGNLIERHYLDFTWTKDGQDYLLRQAFRYVFNHPTLSMIPEGA